MLKQSLNKCVFFNMLMRIKLHCKAKVDNFATSVPTLFSIYLNEFKLVWCGIKLYTSGVRWWRKDQKSSDLDSSQPQLCILTILLFINKHLLFNITYHTNSRSNSFVNRWSRIIIIWDWRRKADIDPRTLLWTQLKNIIKII